MTARAPSRGQKSVREYLEELRKSKEGRPEQVRDGLESFIGLWEGAVRNGVVKEEDEVGKALEKIDAAGGLYKAAEGADRVTS